jgi:hypothetical protein
VDFPLANLLGELCLFPVRRRWKQTATREFAPPFLLLLFHLPPRLVVVPASLVVPPRLVVAPKTRFAAQKPTIAAQHSVRSA